MEQKITIEELAVMIKRGFDETAKKIDVDKRFESMDKRFDGVDRRLDHIDARLNTIEHDIQEIRVDMVHRHEFEDALARIKYVERKLGIENGVE